MSRIGKHTEHFLLDLIRFFRQINTVAERLAHLRLSVNSRKTQTRLILRKQDLRLNQCIAIYRIKLSYDLFCLLQHRKLIFPYRNRRRLKRGDIRRLTDRICKESDRDARFKITHLDLWFHRRIPLQTWYRHQIHIVERQFAKFRNLRLDKQRRFLRIQTARKIVQRNLNDILAHFLRIVGIIRQRLRIRDHDENLVVLAGVLELHPALQRTDIVADMQSSGGPISSQYNLFHYSFPFACFVFFGWRLRRARLAS